MRFVICNGVVKQNEKILIKTFCIKKIHKKLRSIILRKLLAEHFFCLAKLTQYLISETFKIYTVCLFPTAKITFYISSIKL